jgi:hypothetical protein
MGDMTQQRPIFGFLWPARAQPLDGDAEQRRLIRLNGRGPLRLLLLFVATLGTAALVGTVLLAASSVGWVLVLMSAFVCASALVLLLRGWVVGTYVNDDGFAIQRLFGADVGVWRHVSQVQARNGIWFIHLLDGTALPTHVSTRNLDLLGRPQAFDMAGLRLQRWHEGHGHH